MKILFAKTSKGKLKKIVDRKLRTQGKKILQLTGMKSANIKPQN